jgi:hypothetical protein
VVVTAQSLCIFEGFVSAAAPACPGRLAAVAYETKTACRRLSGQVGARSVTPQRRERVIYGHEAEG